MDLGKIFNASVISIIRNANIDLMYAFNTTSKLTALFHPSPIPDMQH